MQIQPFVYTQAYALVRDFGGQVLNSILVGGVVAWILSLGREREKRAARAQVAEQLCRVFGMRLFRSRTTKKLELEPLAGQSLQGWASLDRLQWNLDLHRADINTRELTIVQGVIEDLMRIKANQFTAELHILDDYLPAAAKAFLPPRLRAQFLEQAKYVGLPSLIDAPPR
ncbi:MAG: hypothetical protein KJS97_03695 [Alphaproteobacteria bacterium]|nr:hypothetical protein [Alphaproteobacteria bacterium]